MCDEEEEHMSIALDALRRPGSVIRALAIAALAVSLVACSGGTVAPTAAPTSATSAAPSSAAPSEAAAKPLIGFSNILRTGCAFCTDVEKSVTEEVGKAGWDLYAVDNNLDANQILANADAMVTKGVDVYLDFDGGITNYSATIDKMKAANIPIVFVDGPFPDFANPNAYWMGANSGVAGTQLGEYAVKYAKDNWGGQIDAIFATFQSTWPDETKKRLVEAMNVISAFDSKLTMDTITISDAVLAGEKTQAEATAFLNAHPGKKHLLFIATTNDVAGLAEESAMDAAGRKGDGIVLSMGADSSAQEAIRAGGDFKMSVAFGPEKYGLKLVPLVQQILDGQVPPVITRADAFVVDASNIDQLYPQ
jgi:ABC-type sugar transport system substrate-binding protein